MKEEKEKPALFRDGMGQNFIGAGQFALHDLHFKFYQKLRQVKVKKVKNG